MPNSAGPPPPRRTAASGPSRARCSAANASQLASFSTPLSHTQVAAGSTVAASPSMRTLSPLQRPPLHSRGLTPALPACPPSSAQCMTCGPGCLSCEVEDGLKCTSCVDRHTFQPGSKTCTPNLDACLSLKPGCSVCSPLDPTECLVCDDGFGLGYDDNGATVVSGRCCCSAAQLASAAAAAPLPVYAAPAMLPAAALMRALVAPRARCSAAPATHPATASHARTGSSPTGAPSVRPTARMLTTALERRRVSCRVCLLACRLLLALEQAAGTMTRHPPPPPSFYHRRRLYPLRRAVRRVPVGRAHPLAGVHQMRG